MKKFTVSLMILFFVLIGIVGSGFGAVLFQEGNPVPIISAIVKLELSQEVYEQVGESEKGNQFISRNDGDSRSTIVIDYMAEHEWNFQEQMGSALLFEKEGKRSIVETRLYSKYYFLWHVPSDAL